MLPEILAQFSVTPSFIAAAIFLIMMPGPDNLFVLALGLNTDKRTALSTAWGLATGCLVHTATVTLGVAALLHGHAQAMTVIQWLGAVYLLYLAYQSYQHRYQVIAAKPDNNHTATTSVWRWYRRGVVMNVLNPKVMLFFMAFLPQFVPANSPSPSIQLAVLGMAFALLTACIFSLIALLSGRLAPAIRQRPQLAYYLSWSMVVIFVLLAVRLILP